MLKPKAAHAFKTKVFAAAGFQPEKKDQHGTQVRTDRRIGQRPLAKGHLAIEEVTDGSLVRQVEATLPGELRDQAAR